MELVVLEGLSASEDLGLERYEREALHATNCYNVTLHLYSNRVWSTFDVSENQGGSQVHASYKPIISNSKDVFLGGLLNL